MNTIEKNYSARWRPGRWVASFAVVIAISIIAAWQTVSKAESSIEQDGTPARPYADASKCPPSTDIVIWPSDDRPIPSMPPGISVCVVATQSLNDAGRDMHARDH